MFKKEIILYLRLMQKYNNIKAVLFLFLFSIYLLHQSVPHFHHEHEEIANNVIATAKKSCLSFIM